MGITVYLTQHDGGAGPAWRLPEGITVESFDENELDHRGRLDLDQAWRMMDLGFAELGQPYVFEFEQGDATWSVEEVQRLANRLVLIAPDRMAALVEEIRGDDWGEYVRPYYEQFRRFVCESAAACFEIEVVYN